MPTHVEKGVHLATRVAGDQHWVLAHVGGEEVARVWNLAFMAKEEPASGEYLLQFLLVDLLVREYPPNNQPSVSIHQASNIDDHLSPFQSGYRLWQFLTLRARRDFSGW